MQGTATMNEMPPTHPPTNMVVGAGRRGKGKVSKHAKGRRGRHGRGYKGA